MVINMLVFTDPNLRDNIARFFSDKGGATAIEYSLIATLIGVVIITSVTTIGSKLNSTFSQVAAKLK
jgi:pilus assembly protein Flp/PilA